MANDESSSTPLSGLIEKIKLTGSIGKEEQKRINATALIKELPAKDITALNELTELIQNGRVKVQ